MFCGQNSATYKHLWNYWLIALILNKKYLCKTVGGTERSLNNYKLCLLFHKSIMML